MILTGQSHYVTKNMENLTANISNADFAAINELQNNLKLKGVEL